MSATKFRCLCLVVVGLLPAMALADYRNYTDGISAMGNNNARAEELLKQALRAEPEAKARVRLYGANFKPYIPHYYLARVMASQNRCSEALTYINNASYRALLSNAQVKGEAVDDGKIRTQCQTPVANNTTGSQSSSSQTQASTQSQTGQTQAQAQTQTQTPVPALSDVEKRSGQQTLTALRNAIAKAERNKVSNAAQNAKGALDSLNAALVGSDGAALKRAISEAQGVAQRLNLAADQALAALAKPEPPSTPERPAAPQALRAIVQAFLAGSYREVLSLDAAGMEAKAEAYARMLKSAAAFYLFELGERQDANLQQRATTERDQSRRLKPGIAPTQRFFSPRFVSFWGR
jgi:hypothetical protein